MTIKHSEQRDDSFRKCFRKLFPPTLPDITETLQHM